MNAMTDVPADAVEKLAYYDVRSVSETQLRRIFSCTAEQLAEVRASEEYQEALSRQAFEVTDEATSIDDGWNALERGAIADLQQVMGSINDPRMLLGIAVQANKAARRSGGTTPNQQRTSNNIEVPTSGGTSKVIRLRTRFAETLIDPNGAQRIIDRQAEIQVQQTFDSREDLTPGEVKRILRENVGVDTDALHYRHHAGPDAFIDFSKITEE